MIFFSGEAAASAMDIGVHMRDLGTLDSEPLRDAVLAQEDAAWREQEHRQRAYDVHHDTESIVLLFCDDQWPHPIVTREPGWRRLAGVAMPIVDDLVARNYAQGGVVLRAMAARLKARGRIAPHVDHLPSFRAAHRVHIPLTTNPGVRFTVDGRPCAMPVGNAIEINNQRIHSVMNAGTDDRISFIFDYRPPAP